MEQAMIDPQALHAEPPEPPALVPEEPTDEHDQGEHPTGPPVFSLELQFESDMTLADAQAVWRRGMELIESARAKGLNLVAGGVLPTAPEEASQQQMEAALAELADLEAQRPATG